MPFMKISQGPTYVKTGTPKEKKQRRIQNLADEIFADLLSSSREDRNARRLGAVRSDDGVMEAKGQRRR